MLEGHAALAAAWDQLTGMLRNAAQPAERNGVWRDEWLGPWARLFGVALAQRQSFAGVHTMLDVQGGKADLACAVAAAQPQLQASTLVAPAQHDAAAAHIDACGLAVRVRALPLHGAWPQADVVVLNRWSPACELPLSDELALARAALRPGGRVLLIDHLLDDARRHDAAALMAILSRRMAGEPVSTRTVRAAQALCEAAGFVRPECVPLLGGASAVQAFV
jgi:hypothetical protein